MKRSLILTMLILLGALSAFAQETYATYTSFGVTLNADMSTTLEPGNRSLYIYVHGPDSDDQINLIIKEKDWDAMRQAMIKVKAKYMEWKQIAKDNDITSLAKLMDITLPECLVCWKDYDNWVISEYKSWLGPVLMHISDNGTNISYACSSGGEAVSVKNEYVTKKFYLMFNDEYEIQSFIDLFDIDRINKELNKADLFK